MFSIKSTVEGLGSLATPSPLRVVEKPREVWEKIGPIVDEWLARADDLYKQAELDDPNSGDIFRISGSVSQVILSCLRSPTPTIDTVLVCVGADEDVYEAIGVGSEEDGWLEAVVTNPKNLPHPINSVSGQVRGAGSMLVTAFATKVLGHGRDVVLEPTKITISFYKGLGFEECLDEGSGKTLMRLSAASIDARKQEGTSSFATLSPATSVA